MLGCTPNKRLRIGDPRLEVSVSAPSNWYASPKEGGTSHQSKTPSVATIEFDENGRLWPCEDKYRPRCQLDATLKFIKEARSQVKDKQLVVLTYVHGWHHNAGVGSYNLKNFQMMVNCLNWGNPKDDNISEVNAYEPAICSGMRPDKENFYVGVYIGWRGESMKSFCCGLTSLSVLNRHNDAARVAAQTKDNGIERTILKLSKTAKQGEQPAKFVLLGHSFGGLIVNRIATDIYEKRLASNKSINETACSDLGLPFTPFADLIVVINPADSALHVADLISRFKSRSKCPATQKASGLQRPLVVSLHTSSDKVTGNIGSLALKLAPWVDREYMKDIARDWANRPDQQNLLDDPPTVSDLRRNTVNYVPYLRNTCYLDQPNRQDILCLGLNDRIYTVKQQAFRTTFPDKSDPKPYNTDYSVDPFFHGAYELLTSVCVTDQELEIANSQWSRRHQFKPDFNSQNHCDDPEHPEYAALRKRFRMALVKGLQQYLAFPNDSGEFSDDLLLDIYRRVHAGLSCGDIKYDEEDHAELQGRQCPMYENTQRIPGDSPWNQTPVWMINTSYEILQEHSGFWNTDTFSIITGIAAQFDVVNDSDDYDNLPKEFSQPGLHNDDPLQGGGLLRKKRFSWPWSRNGQQQQQQQGEQKGTKRRR